MRLLDENLPRLSAVSTYPPAIPIFSVVFPDITDELSVFLFKANPPFSGTSYILVDFTLVILPFCSHFILFFLYIEPFPSPYKYFFHPKNKSSHQFHVSLQLHYSISLLPVTAKFPVCCLCLRHQCFSSFESLSSQAFLITSPLQLLWSRASVITPLNPVINSQPSFFLNFLQCLKQVTPTSFRHFIFLLGN